MYSVVAHNVQAYRRMAMEAALGIDAINRYAEIQLQWADENESDHPEAAEHYREKWYQVLDALNGFPREQVAGEVFDMLCPAPHDGELQ